MAIASLLGVWKDGPVNPGIPTNTAVQLDLPRGTDGDIEIRLVDHLGDRVDLDIDGDDELMLSVRSTTVGGVIKSWLATKADGEVGLYKFALAAADTLWIFGLNIFDVWAKRDGAQKQVVAASYFNAGMRVRD